MDSPSGISSNSSGLQNSGSEEDLRKRKRMISNRESARRSRLRKQNHLDGLTAQVAQLRKHNHQILTGLKATTQDYINVESENVILRAQAAELSHRLHSLLEILGFLNDGYPSPEPSGFPPGEDGAAGAGLACFLNNSWSCLSQPIVMMTAPTDTGILF
ncbi:hypothetical protein ACS0TY_003793 [Phlomoides rotata]